MADPVRFKRHIRFLQKDGIVRSLATINGGVDLPAGEHFLRTLEVITDLPLAADLNERLANRMAVDEALAAGLTDRLFETGLIEAYDDADNTHARFDRQLHFFDVLAPVKEHGMNIQRQQRLSEAQVLVLGLGGIGHQVALSLAAAGVGSLVLVDGDIVEESNLHRQILFGHGDAGRTKVDAARDGVLRVAPFCDVRLHEAMIGSRAEWSDLIGAFPKARHVMISADRPIELVAWISDLRCEFNYHAIKCGYMGTQGIIGPLLGPDTPGYDDLFESWGTLVNAQPAAIKELNENAVAPTLAASNAIMANIAALELIKHITGAGSLTLLGRRLLLDLTNYTTSIG